MAASIVKQVVAIQEHAVLSKHAHITNNKNNKCGIAWLFVEYLYLDKAIKKPDVLKPDPSSAEHSCWKKGGISKYFN